MDLLWIGLAIIASFVLGFILPDLLKRYNLLNNDNKMFTDQLLVLSRIIATKIIKDNGDRTRVIDILGIVQNVFDYIYKMGNDISDKEKVELAMQQIIDRLNDFNIRVDVDEIELIEVVIKNLIKYMPKR